MLILLTISLEDRNSILLQYQRLQWEEAGSPLFFFIHFYTLIPVLSQNHIRVKAFHSGGHAEEVSLTTGLEE
jgi:hypothetical protein